MAQLRKGARDRDQRRPLRLRPPLPQRARRLRSPRRLVRPAGVKRLYQSQPELKADNQGRLARPSEEQPRVVRRSGVVVPVAERCGAEVVGS